jgi:hypothetical protein
MFIAVILLTAFVFGATETVAHPDLESPLLRPLPPAQEGRVQQAYGLFSCTCPNLASVPLGAPQCGCKEAVEDRRVLEEGLKGHEKQELDSGLALVETVLDVIEAEPRMRRALNFPQEKFDVLWDTTRSVCPAELLKVYRIGPISCQIRATWGLRFKTFLALGYEVPEIFNFYVQEVNVDLPEEKQFEAHQLKYEEAGNAAIFLPLIGGIVVFGAFRMFRARRRKSQEGSGVQSNKSKHRRLSSAEEALLREEIEDSLER